MANAPTPERFKQILIRDKQNELKVTNTKLNLSKRSKRYALFSKFQFFINELKFPNQFKFV